MPIAQAISVSGDALTIIDFYEEGEKSEYTYSFSTQSQTQNYKIIEYHHSGYDLREFISLSQTEFKQVPPHSSASFKIYLDFNEESIPPGRHESRVIISETETSGGTVGALAQVGIRVIIVSLFPTEYLVWSLSSNNVNEGETAVFTASMRNWGIPDVNDARVEFKVYDKDSNYITQLDSEVITINSRDEGKVSVEFDTTGLQPDDYIINAQLYYSDQTDDKATSFRVGSKTIKILNITRSFVPEAINRAEIKISSGWNSNIEEIEGEVGIYKGTKRVHEFKIERSSLKAWEIKDLLGYFDTSSLERGEYEAAVAIRFEDSNAAARFPIKIENSASTTTVTQIPGNLNFLSFQTLIIVLLLVILAFNIYYMSKRK